MDAERKIWPQPTCEGVYPGSPMNRKSATRLLTTLLLVTSALWSVAAQEFALPSAPNSVKFAAIGDTGSGDPEQYDVANQKIGRASCRERV